MPRRSPLSDAEKTCGKLGKILGGAIDKSLSGWGFALVLFSYGEEGFSTYISSCQRPDMIKAFRELIKRLEADPERRGEFVSTD